jgi:endonuclease-3
LAQAQVNIVEPSRASKLRQTPATRSAAVARPLVPRGRIAAVMRRLARAIDGLDEPAVEKIAEEQQEDPFQVLIATMLSAQTRDPVTAAASARLFKVARTPRSMAALTVRRIERLIYPVSFYRNKAVHVKDTCAQIMSRFGGEVPATMEELLTLPGVGRKTANLVLILAHSSTSNICVDTHVHRISNRLGWAATRTPDETEQALYKAAQRRWWPIVNLYLVTWGQNVCRPVYPRCGSCVIADLCPKIGVRGRGRPRTNTGRGQTRAADKHGPRTNTGRGLTRAADKHGQTRAAD